MMKEMFQNFAKDMLGAQAGATARRDAPWGGQAAAAPRDSRDDIIKGLQAQLASMQQAHQAQMAALQQTIAGLNSRLSGGGYLPGQEYAQLQQQRKQQQQHQPQAEKVRRQGTTEGKQGTVPGRPPSRERARNTAQLPCLPTYREPVECDLMAVG